MNINSISLVRRRRAAILELVREHAVRSQEALQQLLRRRGFTVAQPTLSRDLKDLRLTYSRLGCQHQAGNDRASAERLFQGGEQVVW